MLERAIFLVFDKATVDLALLTGGFSSHHGHHRLFSRFGVIATLLMEIEHFAERKVRTDITVKDEEEIRVTAADLVSEVVQTSSSAQRLYGRKARLQRCHQACQTSLL